MAGNGQMFPFPQPTSIEGRWAYDETQHRMEDINYIWIDAVQPEHTLSDNENYLL